MTHLNIQPESIKLLEESTGADLLDINLDDELSGLTPKAKAIKAKVNSRDDS